MASENLPGSTVPDAARLRSIIESHRPDLGIYQGFYRQVHQDPEIPGMEENTARLVAGPLRRLGYKVHTGIDGHRVVGLLRNGRGKTILLRAELDTLPIREQTDVCYRSEKRMVDRYGNERPFMHACGHDMNMATLFAASALLQRPVDSWTGTVVVVFQPGEETGGAEAVVNDGLYDRVLVPNIMLSQHVVPSPAGTVAIPSALSQLR